MLPVKLYISTRYLAIQITVSRQSCSALKNGSLDFNLIHIFGFFESTRYENQHQMCWRLFPLFGPLESTEVLQNLFYVKFLLISPSKKCPLHSAFSLEPKTEKSLQLIRCLFLHNQFDTRNPKIWIRIRSNESFFELPPK